MYSIVGEDAIAIGDNTIGLNPSLSDDNEELMLLEKILQELQEIPDDQLPQLYDLVRQFRLSVTEQGRSPRTPGLLVGKLSDSFFDPLPSEELQAWE